MRATFVFITALLVGCGSAAKSAPADKTGGPPPSDTAAPTAAADPAAPEAADSGSAAVDTVDLTRGVRIETHGAELMLRGTSTTHPSTSVTVVRAEVEVIKGDKQTISLEREQPGDPKFVEVLGLQMALDSVDSSTKPSTARILVRR